jgi:hypothetical protein
VDVIVNGDKAKVSLKRQKQIKQKNKKEKRSQLKYHALNAQKTEVIKNDQDL